MGSRRLDPSGDLSGDPIGANTHGAHAADSANTIQQTQQLPFFTTFVKEFGESFVLAFESKEKKLERKSKKV